MEENGVLKDNLEFLDESVDLLIKKYTSEAGVRQLERNIAAICRSIAV
jgi:ATP-dependent Lon protease